MLSSDLDVCHLCQGFGLLVLEVLTRLRYCVGKDLIYVVILSCQDRLVLVDPELV